MRGRLGAARVKWRPVLLRLCRMAENTRDLFRGAQSPKVVDAGERVGPIELDVVSVVLHAIHDTVAVGIPSARYPCERDAFLYTRPEFLEPVFVSRNPPVQPCLNDLAHLPVGRGVGVTLDLVGQKLAVTHSALLVLREAECGLAQRFCESRENVLRGGLIVPHMRA